MGDTIPFFDLVMSEVSNLKDDDWPEYRRNTSDLIKSRPDLDELYEMARDPDFRRFVGMTIGARMAILFRSAIVMSGRRPRSDQPVAIIKQHALYGRF